MRKAMCQWKILKTKMMIEVETGRRRTMEMAGIVGDKILENCFWDDGLRFDFTHYSYR